MGEGASTPALIEENDVEALQVEKLKVFMPAATAWAAVEEKYRFGSRCSVTLPIQLMAVAGWVVSVCLESAGHEVGTSKR